MAFTIPNGETETIINRADALDAVENPDIKGYILDIQGSDIRLVTENNQEFASAGLPLQNGDTVPVNPHGNALVAFADGAQATVTVYPAYFTLGELAR